VEVAGSAEEVIAPHCVSPREASTRPIAAHACKSADSQGPAVEEPGSTRLIVARRVPLCSFSPAEVAAALGAARDAWLQGPDEAALVAQLQALLSKLTGGAQ